MNVVVSREHKSLVIPKTTATKNLFPGAPELPGGNNLVVPHTLHESHLLRHIGYKTPNPMLAYYDWGAAQPFEVQRQTCALLTENPRAYVLNHMGTGKTKTALWSWDYLYQQGLCGKALIVAPLSTLHFVWAREAFATLPRRKVSVLHGTKAERLSALAGSGADIFIINHDGLKVIEADLHARTDIDVLILDELAVYRNNSQRSKAMRKFAQRFSCVWGMSGAPMPNKPTDVWAQCKIVTPQTVPQFYRQAESILMNRISQFKLVPKPDAVEKAFKWMQPSVRFALDDVVELPELVSRVIDVPLSKEQSKAYDKLAREFRTMVEDKAITALNAAAAMSKLLQVSQGWVYTTSPEYVELDATPRIEALMDILEGTERKVMVFVPFRHSLTGLAKHLDKEGYENVTVHGGTPNRDKIFHLFQNTEKYKVLLAHPECLAHGVTLTAADTVIWYGPTASLEIYEQANARIRRVGQKHKQQILHLQGTPVEKKIYALLRGKQKVQDQLLDMFEDATAKRDGARS